MARYCSKECQRNAWKAGHKHCCAQLIDGGSLAFLDNFYHQNGFSDEEHSASNLVVTPEGLFGSNQDHRIDVSRAFWNNSARLIFPYFEEDPWAEDELSKGRPEALIRLLEPMRLLQALAANVSQDLQDAIPDCQTAVKEAYRLFLLHQKAMYSKNSVETKLKSVSRLWTSGILWTVALDRLLNKEGGDENGERATRIRINRARALHTAQLSLSGGDRGFFSDTAHFFLGFWRPIKEFEQPPFNPENGIGKDQRGRWDLAIALALAAIGDARLAAKAKNAKPETRAMAYLLFAEISDVTIRSTDKREAAVKRAVALVQGGHDGDMTQLQRNERRQRQSTIRKEAERILQGMQGARDHQPPIWRINFLLSNELFHVATSDDIETMGGGGYSTFDGMKLEEFEFFDCSDQEECVVCKMFENRGKNKKNNGSILPPGE